MSLLPPTSSLAERVEALFAAVRGRGMALGPLDRVVLAGWAESGVPLQVVARGMLRAAERVRWMGSGGGVPRTLGACRPEVEEEIAAWKQRRLGAPTARNEVFDTASPGSSALVTTTADGFRVEVPVVVFDIAPAGRESAAEDRRTALDEVDPSRRTVTAPSSGGALRAAATADPMNEGFDTTRGGRESAEPLTDDRVLPQAVRD